MSVLACSRSDCDNIMCDRIVLNNYYLCDECFAELKEYKKTWPERMRKNEVTKRIEDFLTSTKNFYIMLEDSEIDEEFNRLT